MHTHRVPNNHRDQTSPQVIRPTQWTLTISADTFFKLCVLLILLYLIVGKNLNPTNERSTLYNPTASSQNPQLAEAVQVSKSWESELVAVELPKAAKSHIAYYLDPGFAKRFGVPKEEVEVSMEFCIQYVSKYSSLAVAEMERSGVPASITLAQGLLESNAGQSRLATTTNNHFGIKCFSKACKKGHCKNFTDDSHKDFFVAYPKVGESYRAHSQFLKAGKRYKSLFSLDKKDYSGWAKGLSAAGYATDKRYADKLIALIVGMKLHRFDQ